MALPINLWSRYCERLLESADLINGVSSPASSPQRTCSSAHLLPRSCVKNPFLTYWHHRNRGRERIMLKTSWNADSASWMLLNLLGFCIICFEKRLNQTRHWFVSICSSTAGRQTDIVGWHGPDLCLEEGSICFWYLCIRELSSREYGSGRDGVGPSTIFITTAKKFCPSKACAKQHIS